MALAYTCRNLRRTAASHMTGIGISRLVVNKLLNHVERGITAVYDRHSYDSEKVAALAKWDRRAAEILARSSSPAAEAPSSTEGSAATAAS